MAAALSGLVRWFTARSWAVAAGALLACYLLGMLLPVYSDEIGWRFSHRAAYDGGVDISGNDLCGPATIAAPPWFMMPMRWFSWAANSAFPAPVYVRLAGVACALLWLGLLVQLARKCFADRAERNLQATLVLSLMGLGWLPLIMVMSRPEQPIILVTALVVLIGLSRPAADNIGTWLRGTAIVVLVALSTSYHPKGVVYSVVAAVAIWFCGRGRATPGARLLLLVGLVALDYAAFHYWVTRLACPGDPVLARAWAKENVALLLAQPHGMTVLLQQVIAGLDLSRYPALAMPINNPMSFWLPAGLFPQAPLPWLGGAILLVWDVALVLAGIQAWRFYAARRMQALREPRWLLGLSLVACVVVWGSTQIIRNVYEAGHSLPMLALGVLLLNGLPVKPWPVWSRAAKALVAVLLPLAMASQVFAFASAGPALRAAAGRSGYLPGQPLSASIGDYRPVSRDIDAAMAGAGFEQGRRLRGLVVDSVTYLHLQQSYRPFERQSVIGPFKGSITDPIAYLRSRRSDGIVVGCQFLANDLRRRAARAGDVCAIALSGPGRP